MAYRTKHPCRRCDEIAALICSRCGDYYCSENCQTSDWPSHRYICLPKPPLIKAGTVLKDSNQPKLDTLNANTIKEQFHILCNDFQRMMQQLEAQNNCVRDGTAALNASGMTPHDFLEVHGERMKQSIKRTNKKETDNQKTLSMRAMSSNSFKENSFNMDNQSLLNSNSNSNSDNLLDEQNIVKIVSFRSSNFVCIVHKALKNFHSEILNKVDKIGQKCPIMLVMPMPNSYAIATEGNFYGRVKIVSVTSSVRIRVEFIDHGYYANRKLIELRESTNEVNNFPNVINVLKLHKVDYVNYNDEIKRFLKTFKNKLYKLKYVHEGQKLIELYSLERNESINQRLQQGYNELDTSIDNIEEQSELKTTNKNNTQEKQNVFNGENNNDVKKCTNDYRSLMSVVQQKQQTKITKQTKECEILTSNLPAPFTSHFFTENMSNIKAIIVDTTLAEYGYIACIAEEHLPQLSKVQTFLENMKKPVEAYKPKLNEYVIAQFEDSWYRGQIIDIISESNQYKVSYVDFLNEATLTCKNIRQYPIDLQIDCYTTLCLLDGLPKNLSAQMRQFLKNDLCIYDKILIDRVVENNDDAAKIECHQILERLYKKGLF